MVDENLTLICLPFAGGGPALYRPWRPLAPDWLHIENICLPGREHLFGQQPFRRIDDMVAWLRNELAETLRSPYALFGHSMGGAVAYALTLRQQALGLPLPEHLFVSACAPPPLSKPEPFYAMSETQLFEALRRYDPEKFVFDTHPELWDLFQPLLRADFEVIEAYTPAIADRVVHVPLTAFSASEDRISPSEEIAKWDVRTSKQFSHDILDGGHFFLREAPLPLFEKVIRYLRATE